MGNVGLPRSQTGNGTATPATAALASVAAGDLLVCYIACVGSTATSIATPTGDSWVAVQNQAGSGSGVPSFAMFILPNAGAGTHTPSSVLTGTLTGWVITIFEFNVSLGAGEALISSAVQTSAVAQLTNAFPTNLGQAQPNELFLYSVLRIGATTISNPVSGLNSWAPPGYNGVSLWSSSVQPLANVQGLSLDFYWGDANASWPCPYPQGSGLLSSAVNSVAIAAWLNSAATIPSSNTGCNIGGLIGSYVGPFNTGMVGG